MRPGRALAALHHDDHADDEGNACARYTDDYSTALLSGTSDVCYEGLYQQGRR